MLLFSQEKTDPGSCADDTKPGPKWTEAFPDTTDPPRCQAGHCSDSHRNIHEGVDLGEGLFERHFYLQKTGNQVYFAIPPAPSCPPHLTHTPWLSFKGAGRVDWHTCHEKE